MFYFFPICFTNQEKKKKKNTNSETMSTSESFRGNVPAALEELRQARSGGCLVWFFELLWAYCPESRGLQGTESSPGLMHPSNSNNVDQQQQQAYQQPEGPQPDVLWRIRPSLGGNASGTVTHGAKDSTGIFGNWDEDPDEIATSDADQPHDDFLWLPVVPPTVLLNFSRIQSWYFSPKTRMQMQREISFFSVADEDDARKVYGRNSHGGGTCGFSPSLDSEDNDNNNDDSDINGNNNKGNGPSPQNDIDRLLAQYHRREMEQKKRRDSDVRQRFKDAALPSKPPHHIKTSAVTDLPQPERQLTLGQRQVLGIRAIAKRYKKEHSSNADELPAPVLKRLRGRLSTAVIVDAFEREYIQGLKVENLTAHGLAMQQAEKERRMKTNGGAGGGSSPSILAQLMMSIQDDEEGRKKKRQITIRNFPVGWICPEGPEQKQLQYDRIVAQLIRKSPDRSTHHHYHQCSSSSSNTTNTRNRSSFTNENNDDDDDDQSEARSDRVDALNGSATLNSQNASSSSSKFSRTLPSAAKTAELLTRSLCSPTIEYLTIESLRRVLCSGTLGQAALLQQFVPPPPPSAVGNARFNETLDFRWQPRWRYLERCTNAHPLDDYTVPANKRGPTFEGPPGSSHGAMLAQATLYRLERACRAIVRHVFNVSQHTARILRLHCIFKFDEKLTLVLLCVVEAYAINPRAVPPATTIANILNADAHLPRFRTSLAQQKQQEQLQQLQQLQQQQILLLANKQDNNSSDASSGNTTLFQNRTQQREQKQGNASGFISQQQSKQHQNQSLDDSCQSDLDNNSGHANSSPTRHSNTIHSAGPTKEERRLYMQQRRQQQQNAQLMVSAASSSLSWDGKKKDAVTATGWEAIRLDPDDVRRSPIRALAAMSRGDARQAAIKKTMRERVGAVQIKKDMKMIHDLQGVIKPLEQLRREADAAFASMNPKAAKALDALFSRRDKRRALMKAGNESAYDDDGAGGAGGGGVYSSPHEKKDHHYDSFSPSSRSIVDRVDSQSPTDSSPLNNRTNIITTAGSGASAVKRRRPVNHFNEASETIDDLLWGRQSQLARALLRPVASRDDARKLPFHRRPARSLAAECGASGVGERYIKTMRSASTPEPLTKVADPEVQYRRAFC